LPIIQIADITGVWGVSFLVMMINVAIYKAIGYRLWVIGKKPQNMTIPFFKHILLPIFLLSLFLIYGYYKLNLSAITYHLSPIRISVIQGNIPQEFKWDPEAKDYILEKYLNITRNVNKDKPDLIIWPEAALPVVLEEEPIFIEQVKKLAKEIKISILLGVVNAQNDHYYNSALLISSEGEILTKYDKLHLVPFGEYIPFRKTLRFLETIVPIGDFSRGGKYTVFKTQNSKLKTQNFFSVLICFEDLFPELSREFCKRGADFLVNITNDAWFKKTSSPYQHLQASVFRAVENHVSLVRAANTGVSGFIAPTGEILSSVHDKAGRNIFVDGYATEDINIPKKEISFYTKYGDVFMIICLLFVLLGITARKLMANADV
jgi:apolipoprotein N-acyltransferase